MAVKEGIKRVLRDQNDQTGRRKENGRGRETKDSQCQLIKLFLRQVSSPFRLFNNLSNSFGLNVPQGITRNGFAKLLISTKISINL